MLLRCVYFTIKGADSIVIPISKKATKNTMDKTLFSPLNTTLCKALNLETTPVFSKEVNSLMLFCCFAVFVKYQVVKNLVFEYLIYCSQFFFQLVFFLLHKKNL
jgi:hypothetical protein